MVTSGLSGSKKDGSRFDSRRLWSWLMKYSSFESQILVGGQVCVIIILLLLNSPSVGLKDRPTRALYVSKWSFGLAAKN